MFKRETYLLLNLWLAFPIIHSAKAQSYSLQSLNGKKSNINLSYKLFSKRLTVSCLQDTMYLDNYLGTEKVDVLADKFLQITYAVRAGTEQKLQNTALISVVDNKIKLSMLVQSYVNGFSPMPDNTAAVDNEWLYTLKFSAARVGENSCKLTVNIHQQQKSNLRPQTNYTKNKQAILTFDPKRHIFYHHYQKVDRSFMVVDNRTRKASSKYVKEVLPMISLGEDDYYYIEDDWYSIGYKERLYKEYSR